MTGVWIKENGVVDTMSMCSIKQNTEVLVYEYGSGSGKEGYGVTKGP